jgi:Protein of unknown function (DUF2726)
MFVLEIVAVLVAIVIVLWFKTKFKSNESNTTVGQRTLEISRIGRFFTKSETQYYVALLEAIAGRYLVFPKVRLTDILQATGEHKRSHYNRIRAMHFDFLILSLDFAPLLALEVDGVSHNSERQQKFDATKNEACRVAGFPLHRVRVGEGFGNLISLLEKK